MELYVVKNIKTKYWKRCYPAAFSWRVLGQIEYNEYGNTLKY